MKDGDGKQRSECRTEFTVAVTPEVFSQWLLRNHWLEDENGYDGYVTSVGHSDSGVMRIEINAQYGYEIGHETENWYQVQESYIFHYDVLPLARGLALVSATAMLVEGSDTMRQFRTVEIDAQRLFAPVRMPDGCYMPAVAAQNSDYPESKTSCPPAPIEDDLQPARPASSASEPWERISDPRGREISRLWLQQKTAREIGGTLHLAPKTVQNIIWEKRKEFPDAFPRRRTGRHKSGHPG